MTRCASLVCLLVAVMLLVTPSAEAKRRRQITRGLTIDRTALMALEKSISDFGESKVSAWKGRGNPCFPKPWPHITCANGRVAAIDLSNLDILGTLPKQLKRLNKVVTLNFENNRFAGTIPEEWSDRRRFRSLQTLNLGGNLLTGSLPNRKWNRKGAFKSLEFITLAENSFTGGLPDGWLSTANAFRKLKFLDLADNQLGNNADGSQMAAGDWCLNGRTDDSGWCPTIPSKARAFALEILDLSANNMLGQLPVAWGQMFPNLQFLMIHNNQLYGGATEEPSALPADWTRRTVPRAFPQLESLVLYPGNTYICNLPDPANGGFVDVNGDMSYIVEAEDMVEYDYMNPWFCPGATVDNKVTELTVSMGLDNVELEWKGPSGDDMDKIVYGFRVSLSKQNPDTEEWEPVMGWTARLLKVYGGNDADLTDDDGGPPTYTVDTGIPKEEEGKYKVEVSTFNMNGVESETVSVEEVLTS